MRLPVRELAERYKDDIFRAAFSVCGNIEDAEDAVQEAFIQYMKSSRQFESEEHIRAWLLRTAINKAKNTVRTFWHRNRTSIEDYMDSLQFREPEDRDLAEAVMALPKKQRMVIYLYYYEDDPVSEISDITGLSESAVKGQLFRARKKLKQMLGGDWNDDE